ncbi:MAG: riboflavin synthase [Acidobacteriota bacterium]|nr:riboflavin synthase [Acidobacteriota bacterium]
MFNGLIEAVGEVAMVTPIPAGMRFRVATALAGELSLGESGAGHGVCLTLGATHPTAGHAEVSPETMRVTSLGTLAAGDVVNLERSMRADTRVGGHFVQGHVDNTGRVAGIRHEADFHWITVAFPAPLSPYLVRKGSVAVDGISLTVAELRDGEFDLQIVPFTWTHTNLSRVEEETVVNLECDIIGKYVVRALAVGEYRSLRPGADDVGDLHG